MNFENFKEKINMQCEYVNKLSKQERAEVIVNKNEIIQGLNSVEHILDQNKELEEQIKVLKSQLESQKEVEQKQKTVWDLSVGCASNYWLVDAGCAIYNRDFSTSLDEKIRESGNAFLTKKEAEKERSRRKVEALLLKYGGRREFKHGEDNYNFYYSYRNSRLDFIISRSYCDNNIFFDSKEAIKNAIENIGEERIIKNYFGVKVN